MFGIRKTYVWWSRLFLFTIISVVFVATTGELAVAQQKFPVRPIQLVIPFGPGGGTDIIFRLLGQEAEKHLGKRIVAVNMAGAMSTVGARHVRDARPDGYTLLGTHDVLILTQATGIVDYGSEAFQPVAMVTSTPNIAAVRADAPWTSMVEFIDDARKHPGELTWSAAQGTDNYTFIGGIFDAAEADLGLIRLVSYDDTASELNALLGGHLDGIILNVAAGAQYVKAGKVRFIGVAHDSRLRGFEDVPTLKEMGIDFSHATNRGVFAPKRTPLAVVKVLESAIKSAITDPNVEEKLDKMGTTPYFLDHDGYNNYLVKTSELMNKLFASVRKKK